MHDTAKNSEGYEALIHEVKEREVSNVKRIVMNIVRNWYNDPAMKDALIHEGINLGEPLEYPLFGSLMKPLTEALLKNHEFPTGNPD